MRILKMIYNAILIILAIWLTYLTSGCDRVPWRFSEGGNFPYGISSAEDETDQSSFGTYQPLNYGEVKAIWLSYLELQSFFDGKTESSFTNAVEHAYQQIAEMGFNTVVVQVRPFGDALYSSAYFPWSSIAIRGGGAPDYDPLKILIEQAHQRDLSFHAWINPYRAQAEADAQTVSADYPFGKWLHGPEKGNYIICLDGRWYYNPGAEEVRRLIKAGVCELIHNYPIDGIHMDDYFYPTTAESFDRTLYQQYCLEGGQLELSVWRRENVNALLRDLYQAIKQTNDTILFGVSPQANISNNFNQQYADVLRWCSTAGYLDYLCPQIYYSFKSETTDFTESLDQWLKLTKDSHIKLFIGIASYKLGREDQWACTAASGGSCSAPNDCGRFGWQTTEPWESSILAEQYRIIQSKEQCKGAFLYSYNTLFSPADSVKKQVEAERNALQLTFSE